MTGAQRQSLRYPILTLKLGAEHDVVAARQRARQVAERIGFGPQDRTRIATAVSEIARNTVGYAGGGAMECGIEEVEGAQALVFEFVDRGPGIADLQAVLEGRYTSPTGMGVGMAGARRIMDRFEVKTGAGGTRVVMAKRLPMGVARLDHARIGRLAEEIVRSAPESLAGEVQRQNREVLEAIAELQQLNRELEDTNRGVVALYAELDERVEQLRRSNAMRAQFTSYLSHEFRTPLDSMLALSNLLLNRIDGDLTDEQAKQVHYIQRSARDLLNMVDDLLDTARVESGQVQVRPGEFTVPELFNALRATLRPLLTSDSVRLHFDEGVAPPPLHTDEAKLSQILRNLISNALKFTARGEIRVSAAPATGGREMIFRVVDTGIGIAAEDQARIFEDFAQVDGSVQRQRRGTGLGLALSRKLARILGGEIAVDSELGRGSAFAVTIPIRYEPPAADAALLE